MWRIPLSDLNYDERETAAVRQTLESGWLTMGPRAREFEDAFAASLGGPGAKAVAVANCTCALELVYRYILMTAEPTKRAIIVPDITFVATASAVIAAGGIPILCDAAAPDCPAISGQAVEEILESRNDIAAVTVVHYAGYDAGAEALQAICSRYGVALIEDCAHSPGGKTATGRPLGTIGFAGCFSFFSNKNIATGEGGMILINPQKTSDATAPPLDDWALAARSHGTTGGGTWRRHVAGAVCYDVAFPAYNYRCTEITAALGLAQLDKLETGNARRRELTTLYHDQLQSVDGIRPAYPPDELQNSACHILPVIIENASIRRKIIEALTHHKIQTSHHYPAIHTLSWYRDNDINQSPSLECATAFAEQELTLPLHPKLKNEQVEEIVSVIRNAVS